VRLLALDTSTLTASVAALDTETGALVERRQRVTVHSDVLLELVSAVLDEAGWNARSVEAVACGAGPGSFTGLRIGLATAKGLAFGAGAKLVMVSSLAAMAARVPGRVAAVLDAHKSEVYAGIFDVAGGLTTPVGAERIFSPARLAAELATESELGVVGDGAVRYPELVSGTARRIDDDGAPHAAEVARLAAARLAVGESDALDTARPSYLRASEAEILKAERATLKAVGDESKRLEALRAEHAGLEARLRELDSHLALTTDEQAERTGLKKAKLQLKDDIAKLERSCS